MERVETFMPVAKEEVKLDITLSNFNGGIASAGNGGNLYVSLAYATMSARVLCFAVVRFIMMGATSILQLRSYPRFDWLDTGSILDLTSRKSHWCRFLV
jgi:hypothetical protein